MIGRISRLSVRPPAQSVGPSASALEAEGPHEQGQAEDAVDDRRHAGQVGDVRLDDPPDPARRGVFLEEDRRADPDRDARTRRPGRAARDSPRSRPGTRPSPGRSTAAASTSSRDEAETARGRSSRSAYQGLSGGPWSAAEQDRAQQDRQHDHPGQRRQQAGHAEERAQRARRSQRCGLVSAGRGVRLIDRPRGNAARPAPR